jgi:hypothetical protein
MGTVRWYSGQDVIGFEIYKDDAIELEAGCQGSCVQPPRLLIKRSVDLITFLRNFLQRQAGTQDRRQ